MVIDKKLVRLEDLKDAYDKAANKEDVDNKFIEVDNSLSQLSEENVELKGDLDEVDNKIESDIYPSKTKIVNAEYASGPAINVFFIPYSDTIKKDTEVVLYFKGYASKEVKVVSCNGTKVGSIGTAKTYNVDENGYFTIIPEYDKGYANAEYVRVLCFGYNPSTEDWIYEIKNKNGILKRLDDLEYTLEKSINDIDSNIYLVKNGINDMTDKKIAQSSSEGLKILMMSDIHLGVELQTSLETRWGYTDEERMNELVKVILNEYEQGQIDFILFLGDQVSNQFESTSTSHKYEDFLPLFIKKMKELQIPFYCTMGNHELYDETKWMELFGYPSNYIIEIKGLSIIVLNTFTNKNVDNPSSTGTDLKILTMI